MANESMKCSSSAQPGSSYMHPERLLLPQITKTSCGLSEVPKGKVVVQRLGGGDDTLSPVSCVTSGRCHSSSETSISGSASSIQWSSAEDDVIEDNVKEPIGSVDGDMVMIVGGHRSPLEEHGLCMTWFKESKQSEASARYSINGATTSKGQPCGKPVGTSQRKGATFQLDYQIITRGNSATKLKLANEEATCMNQEKDTDKLPPILEPTRGEPSSQCQLLDQSEISDHLYEVKVCDTCGDVGREHLLVSCSKCSDGAEHIYCMRVKLDKLPEGCWICEDCKLEEGKRTEEKQKQNRDVELELNAALMTKVGACAVNLSSIGNKTPLNSKDTAVGNSRTFKDSSCSSAKMPSLSLVVTPTAGKGAIETSEMASKLTNSLSQALLPNSTSLERSATNCEGSFHGSVSLDDSSNSQPRYAKNSNIGLPSSKLSGIEELERIENHNDQSSDRSTIAQEDARPTAEIHGTNGSLCGSTLDQEIHQESERKLLSGPKLKNSSSSVSEIGDSLLQIEGQKHTVAVDLDRTPHSAKATELDVTNTLDEGKNEVGGVGVAVERPNSTEVAPFTQISNSVEPLPWWTSSTSGMSAIPESTCVWKGGFLINKDGRPLGTIVGVQAHISTRPTHMVLQNMREFPRTILLEKVACINKGSTQFRVEQAREDNTVLFSLLNDLQSFEGNEGSLSDCLVADDVCLEGEIGGFELLIFSSNLLLDRSQSWKKLFPLCGVLKRTSDCSLDLLPPRAGVPIHNLNTAQANSQNSKASVLSSANTTFCGSVVIDMESNPSTSSTATILAPVGATKLCTREISSGNKSLHLPRPNETDSLSWHHQMLVESYSSQGDSTVSKRRREINLNKENCSNGGRFAEEPEPTRLRTSKETFTYLGFNDSDVIAKGFDPRFGCSSIASGLNSAHEQTSGWFACPKPGIPSLELSLGTPEKTAKPLALKQFLGMDGDEKFFNHHRAMGDCMEDGAWLSLSLPLPSSGKEQLKRGPTLTKEIDTSLSLSCGIGI